MVIIHVNFHENKILLTHFRKIKIATLKLREMLPCQNGEIKPRKYKWVFYVF